MRKFSKLFAIMTMVALLLTSIMPVSVFAAGGEGNEDGSITIISNGLDLTGQVFDAYKIFNLTYDEINHSYFYTLVDKFEDFENYPGFSEGKTLQEFLLTPVANVPDAEEMIALSDALWEYINDWNVANSGNKITPAGTRTGEGVITPIDLGYYLVTGSILAEGGVKVIAACSLTTNDKNADVTPKADAPTIDKKVYNDNGDIADVNDLGEEDDLVFVPGGWQDWADLDIGHTAYFQLTTEVPKMVGYDTYEFIVHDNMSSGLTFTPASVIVEIEGITDTSDYYDLIVPGTNHDTGTCTFEIDFDEELFVTIPAGKKITITYSALVNEGAVIGVGGNPNEVYLEYSNDPSYNGAGETGETPPDEVIVYTFDIDVLKYTMVGPDGSQVEKYLGDAWFKLTTDDDGDNNVRLIAGVEKVNGGETTMVYRVAKDNETAITYTGDSAAEYIVSSVNGKIRIDGLDAGTYYLTEIKAPDGYNLLPEADRVIEITIEFDATKEADGKFTTELKYNTVVDTILNPWVLKVRNNAGMEFPGTGGIGRTMFILVGSTMLAAGLISLVVFRKRIFASK